ncbi:MAG: MBL fold metallo-hydrolase [Firmicutes bacterium]|nr:MBL fold metallo-hydrolase [Bacillota bacterium]
MIEKILPGIFRIELPLPDFALQTVNSYLLKGDERDLLIDSGIDEKECRAALLKALRELDVDLERTDFFITHFHEDHFGLAPSIASNRSTIYLTFPEAVYWEDLGRWKAGLVHGLKNGFPEEELKKFINNTPDFLKKFPLDEIKEAVKFYEGRTPSRKTRFQIIGDGEILNVGKYSLRCLMTPGHSCGHICLYEPNEKLLFSGDHILETITPAIFLWSGDDQNPLADYLRSLDRVFNLEIETILPGHRRAFRNHRDRILEIKKHHCRREGEIASVLDVNGKSAYEIASKVSWNIPLPWDKFTVELRWMALAETLAHLKYMEQRGKVKSISQGSKNKNLYCSSC